MNYYKEAFEKYADFSGRSRPAAYWMFVLFHVGVFVLAAILDAILGTGLVFIALYWLASIIPSLAVGSRRLHDTGKSGWVQLISLIPFGSIVLLIFLIQGSQPGPNQYGPNPTGDLGFQAAFAQSTAMPAAIDVTAELERLANLKDRGAITEEEFQQRKDALLAKV
jgi:uncharacterized membrane protein YhaH (DUF805 family)